MLRFYQIIFSLVIFSVFSSCETDFDVTAPYKETTVIYGLLNASDSVQWIRINKAFLGEGNAYEMAMQPDSINYPDILDVTLEEYNINGLPVRSIGLIRDSSITKEPGIFATTPNILYRTNGIDRIDQFSSYKLVVHNRETENLVTAKTNVVDSIVILYPFASSLLQINWYQLSPVTVKWTAVPEGKSYQLTIRFHYDEISLSNPQDEKAKYIDWVFAEQQVSSGQSQQMAQVIAQDEFYHFVKRSVSPDNSVKRKIGALDFIFTVAANEFYTYIQVNKPPTGINQNIPQYTNVENGIGIFSSRLVQALNGKNMTPQSNDSLSFGSITGDLGFY
jgi:hypothetical protein